MQLKLQKRLGDGGESVAVFAARRMRSRRPLPAEFAVKVVSGLNFRLRYLQMLGELTTLAQLAKVSGIRSSLYNTPEERVAHMPQLPLIKDNFVHFYGWTFSHDHFFIAMQLLQCDLETYLQQGSGCYAREITWNQRQPGVPLQRPIGQLIEGLRGLHKAGFTHRDLRPKACSLTT